MYGKIFETMYDGTLYGQWEAMITFQQFIVLCDADGTVDMTPQALAARTGIPIQILEKGIKVLEAADPYSRTLGRNGARIELIDGHRPWGWTIVNHDKYKHLQDADTVRTQTRERVRKHREKKDADTVTVRNPDVTHVTDVTHCNADVTHCNGLKRHTDTDTNTYTDSKNITTLSGKPDVVVLKPVDNFKNQAIEVLSFLNEKTGRKYRHVPANLDLIKARLKEGITIAQCRQVIVKKHREWSSDEKMHTYLRPATLFNRTNFEQYVGTLV